MTEREPRSVLVAEDEALIRLDLVEMLREEGYDVAGEAADGEEAVRLATELRPDLVILDVKMPKVDGIEAARRIRSHQPGTAILMLTGSNSRADVDRARQAGAAGYVTKDRIAAELVDAIVEVTGR